jgi:hypothetical protein
MSDENLTNQEENPEPTDQIEELSKVDAISGVFTSPGDTYETIASTPKKNYWLMAILICIAMGLIATFLFMRDTELAAKTMEKQKRKIREQMEEKVKSGSMSREEAETAIQQSEKFTNAGSVLFRVIGFAGAVVGPFLLLFVLSLVYLIILKIMKAEFDFTNLMNVVGLAMVIGALGNLIGTVISVLKGEISSTGPALFLTESAVGEKVYGVISKIDVFSIWFYVIVGIGISKIAKIETSKAMLVAFIPFVLYLIITFIFS